METKYLAEYIFIGTIIILILFVAIFGINLIKHEKCLKPLAEKLCTNRGMIYDNNDDKFFYCKEDIRDGDLVKLRFLKEEREMCK